MLRGLDHPLHVTSGEELVSLALCVVVLGVCWLMGLMLILWMLVIGFWRLWDQSFVCGGVCKGCYVGWLYVEVWSCDMWCMFAVRVIGIEV